MSKDVTEIWVADFETTTDENDCRVWGWAAAYVPDTDFVVMGTELDEFFSWCQRRKAQISFHNLAFDGTFILDWLFRNGYSHTTEKAARKGEFTTLISMQGQFYSLRVKFMNGNTVEFRDSLKKLPMPVSAIAKAFGTEEVKGEIDYHAHRPVGHELTPDERNYMRSDVVIVAKAMKVQLDQGMTRLTVGSDTLFEYRTLMGGKANFEMLFPVLPESMDADIRRAYKGGFTYASPRFRGRHLGLGKVYDMNSIYPSVMYDEMLPWGRPVFVDGLPEPTEEYPLFVTSITFTAKLKPDHIPCIQVKGSPHFAATHYQEHITEPATLFCTNVDLELWEKHYDLDILSYNGAYLFKASTGFFQTFVDKWNAIKMNSEGGIRVLAKLHLNALYGKFATNPNITGKVPWYKDGVVRLVMGEPETRDPVYTAMGVFITAYARKRTITAAQDHYDVFAYADTDSLHLMCEDHPDDLDIDPSKLGSWKHEMDFSEAVYVRAKCYTERNIKTGQLETHIAGLPKQVAEQVTIHDMLHGATYTGKLLPVRVPGGIVLRDTTFELTP